MWEHLWTQGEMPEDYTDLILCRDVYSCRPSELDEEDGERVLKHLTCLDVEAKKMKAQARTVKRKTR